MTDNTETPFKTMGFCPACERYTAHVCAKCQPATPDPQAEIAALRAERDALKRENAELRDRLRGIEAMSSELAMRSGGVSYGERLIIIESIANGTRVPRRI